MNTSMEFPLIWPVLCILAVGLLSAWFTRVGAGSAQQSLSYVLFFGCLAMVAGTTIVSFAVGPGCWMASATTFCLMVLAATADTRRSRGVGDC
jgi:hypothetical protein